MEDILEGFTCEDIILEDDDEGTVKAVLISKRGKSPSSKAVLYIHGFADYFFQAHMAEKYISAGYDFYAIDLRKYGRALMEHQTPNFCKDTLEYYEELDEAVQRIRERDSHNTLVLSAHSTGGLIGTLYCSARKHFGTINAMVLNSPWYQMNENILRRNISINLMGLPGKLFPFLKAPKGLDPNYAASLHKDYAVEEKKNFGVYEEGNWDFNLQWKPLNGFPLTTGFIRAINLSQKKLKRGIKIACPVLIMYSDKKGKANKLLKEHYFTSDCVLNPAHIEKRSHWIGGDVTRIAVENGMHDLSLSLKPAREYFFQQIFEWLDRKST